MTTAGVPPVSGVTVDASTMTTTQQNTSAPAQWTAEDESAFERIVKEG